MIPAPSASRRSRRIVLRLREDERRQEIVEAGIAVVQPMELLVDALQEPVLAERVPIGLGQEGEMDRRGADLLAQRPQAGDERRPRGVAVGLWRDQQPRTGDGRERHRDLELRIVAPAGALVGVGPAVVEDVLALAMGLRVAGRSGDDLAGAVPRPGHAPAASPSARRRSPNPRAPTGRRARRRGCGSRAAPPRCRPGAGRARAGRVRHGVPLRGRDGLEAIRDADLDFEGRAAHAAIMLLVAASDFDVGRCCCPLIPGQALWG